MCYTSMECFQKFLGISPFRHGVALNGKTRSICLFFFLYSFFLSFFVFDVSRFTRTMTQIESTIGLFGLAFCLLFLAVSVLSSFRDKDMNRDTICCRCFDDLQRFIVCSSG